MTDNGKATPRPWRQGQGYQQDGLRRDVIYAEDGSVARLTRDNYNSDAALIVAAVNAHDDLVAERDKYKEQATFLGNKVADLALELGAAKAERGRLRQALGVARDALEEATRKHADVLHYYIARPTINVALARIREALK